VTCVRVGFETVIVRPFLIHTSVALSVLHKANREGGFGQLPSLFQSFAFERHFFLLPKEPFVFLSPLSFILMAEKITVLPPWDPWPVSSVTYEDLEARVEAGLLRPRSTGSHPEWTTSHDEQVPDLLAGYIVSFTSFHERGFRVPTSCFMWALPHYYGVELHNFNPNSIAQATIFSIICEGFLGIKPHWDLLVHLFHTEPFSLPSKVRRVCHAIRADGCTLQLRSDRVALYIPGTLTSSNKGWQSRWFYLLNDNGRLPAFTHHVVLGAEERWRWGCNRISRPTSSRCWRRCGSSGITVFHRRQVLPLGCGRQPSLPLSLPWQKGQRSQRGKPLPFPRKPSWRLRVHKLGPLSVRPLGGTRRRGRQSPQCHRLGARSGPGHRSALAPTSGVAKVVTTMPPT
jgi:hypothetical protein